MRGGVEPKMTTKVQAFAPGAMTGDAVKEANSGDRREELLRSLFTV